MLDDLLQDLTTEDYKDLLAFLWASQLTVTRENIRAWKMQAKFQQECKCDWPPSPCYCDRASQKVQDFRNHGC